MLAAHTSGTHVTASGGFKSSALERCASAAQSQGCKADAPFTAVTGLAGGGLPPDRTSYSSGGRHTIDAHHTSAVCAFELEFARLPLPLSSYACPPAADRPSPADSMSRVWDGSGAALDACGWDARHQPVGGAGSLLLGSLPAADASGGTVEQRRAAQRTITGRSSEDAYHAGRSLVRAALHGRALKPCAPPPRQRGGSGEPAPGGSVLVVGVVKEELVACGRPPGRPRTPPTSTPGLEARTILDGKCHHPLFRADELPRPSQRAASASQLELPRRPAQRPRMHSTGTACPAVDVALCKTESLEGVPPTGDEARSVCVQVERGLEVGATYRVTLDASGRPSLELLRPPGAPASAPPPAAACEPPPANAACSDADWFEDWAAPSGAEPWDDFNFEGPPSSLAVGELSAEQHGDVELGGTRGAAAAASCRHFAQERAQAAAPAAHGGAVAMAYPSSLPVQAAAFEPPPAQEPPPKSRASDGGRQRNKKKRPAAACDPKHSARHGGPRLCTRPKVLYDGTAEKARASSGRCARLRVTRHSRAASTQHGVARQIAAATAIQRSARVVLAMLSGAAACDGALGTAPAALTASALTAPVRRAAVRCDSPVWALPSDPAEACVGGRPSRSSPTERVDSAVGTTDDGASRRSARPLQCLATPGRGGSALPDAAPPHDGWLEMDDLIEEALLLTNSGTLRHIDSHPDLRMQLASPRYSPGALDAALRPPEATLYACVLHGSEPPHEPPFSHSPCPHPSTSRVVSAPAASNAHPPGSDPMASASADGDSGHALRELDRGHSQASSQAALAAAPSAAAATPQTNDAALRHAMGSQSRAVLQLIVDSSASVLVHTGSRHDLLPGGQAVGVPHPLAPSSLAYAAVGIENAVAYGGEHSHQTFERAAARANVQLDPFCVACDGYETVAQLRSVEEGAVTGVRMRSADLCLETGRLLDMSRHDSAPAGVVGKCDPNDELAPADTSDTLICAWYGRDMDMSTL